MTIETKFNVGQEVWSTANHKVTKFIVEGVCFLCECDNVIKAENNEVIDRHFTHNIVYLLDGDWTLEEFVFATKEELLASL